MNTIACPDCGTLQQLPPPRRGCAALCPVCAHRLERAIGRSLAAAFCFAFLTFLLLFPANLEPLMRISVLGIDRETRIGTGLFTLWNQQWVVLVTLVAAFAIVLPFIRFGLLSVVLACMGLGRTPRWLGPAYKICLLLDVWAMPDVLLLGAAVGYSRIAARLPVTVGAGGICLILAAVCAMLCRATLDRRAGWRRIGCARRAPAYGEPSISCTVCDLALPAAVEGSRCPRCAAALHARKPGTRVRTLALVIAGLALYIPANVFPMNVNVELGQRVDYRIIDGVLDLFKAGFWPLGLLIFFTSIAIPLLKLLGLGWFLLSIRRHSGSRLV